MNTTTTRLAQPPGILKDVLTAPPPNLDKVSRILVYGVTGSGKTTMARRLADLTGLPWHEVDALTWEPGWRAVPLEEQHRRVRSLVAGDRWILDAAYGSMLGFVLPRAELVVGLDYGRALTFAQLVGRTAHRIVDREEICNGNTESLRQALGKDSILRWHLTSYARKRARMATWARDPAGPAIVRFGHPREAEAWLSGLQATHQSAAAPEAPPSPAGRRPS